MHGEYNELAINKLKNGLTVVDGIFTRPRKTRYSEKNMLKTTGNWKGYIKLIDSSCVMCELFLQPVCRYQSEIISTKP